MAKAVATKADVQITLTLSDAEARTLLEYCRISEDPAYFRSYKSDSLIYEIEDVLEAALDSAEAV